MDVKLTNFGNNECISFLIKDNKGTQAYISAWNIEELLPLINKSNMNECHRECQQFIHNNLNFTITIKKVGSKKYFNLRNLN